MYTINYPEEIVFYYAQKDLFKDVRHESAFMCKNIVSKDGADLSEQFAITEDESDMFALCLRESLPATFDTVKVLTHGIPNAFSEAMLGSDVKDIGRDDQRIPPYAPLASLDVVDGEKYVVIRTVNHDAYAANDVKLVDSAMQSAIEEGVLSAFYQRVIHPDLTKATDSLFAVRIASLAQRILPLRKKSKL